MTNPQNSVYAAARNRVMDILEALPRHLRSMLYQEMEISYSWENDHRRNVEFAYAFIRERVARGGKGWKGYAMWQLIETVPKDTLVMVYSPFGYDAAYLNSQTMTWFTREGQQYTFAPMYWMPLPEPPK